MIDCIVTYIDNNFHKLNRMANDIYVRFIPKTTLSKLFTVNTKMEFINLLNVLNGSIHLSISPVPFIIYVEVTEQRQTQ